MDFDTIIFRSLNGLVGRWPMADLAGVFLADWMPFAMVAVLLVLFFWPKKNRPKNREIVVVAFLSGFVSWFIDKGVILFFYARPRPYIALPLVHKLVSISRAYNFQSFPSGHALFFFGLSAAVFLYNKKLGLLFLALSLVMGVSRVFVGVHWPSDIVAGAMLGVVTALLVKAMYRHYKDRLSHATLVG